MQKRPVISKLIIFIIIVALLLRLPFFFHSPLVWWDSAVYVGMAKYIWSSGAVGIWEAQRPLLFPLLLGFFWKMGLDIVMVGKFLTLFFSLGSVLLVYLIGIRIGNRAIGHLSALFFALDPIFYKYMGHILLSIPALFFGLCGIYFYVCYREKERSRRWLYLSSFFLALSMLTRYMFVLLFIGVALDTFLNIFRYRLQKKRFQNAITSFFQLILIFILVTFPYLLFNMIRYGNFLYPFIKKLSHMKASALIMLDQGNFYYLTHLPNLSPILLFVVFGLVIVFLTFRLKNPFNVVSYVLLISLFFFTVFSVQEERYALVFLPFAYLLTFYGISYCFKKRKVRKYVILIILVALFTPWAAIQKTRAYLPLDTSWEESQFYNFFADNQYDGMAIAATSPFPAYFSDVKIVPLYVGYQASMSGQLDYLTVNENISYFQFIYENISCAKDNIYCQSAQQELRITLDKLGDKYAIAYHAEHDGKEYYIFDRSGSVDYLVTPSLSSKPTDKLVVVFRSDDAGAVYREDGKGAIWKFNTFDNLNQLFREKDVPLLLAIIPKDVTELNAEQRDHLRQLLNSDLFSLAQHGFSHDDIGGYSEFFGLSNEEQEEKIKRGRAILEEVFDQEVLVFMPPFDIGDQTTVQVLAEEGYSTYTASIKAPYLTLSELQRFDANVDLVKAWSPEPTLYSFEELKYRFNLIKDFEPYILINFNYYTFTEDDIQTLSDFIDFMEKEGVSFMSIEELGLWTETIKNIDFRQDDTVLRVDVKRSSPFLNQVVFRFKEDGQYQLTGNFLSQLQNLPDPSFFAKNYHNESIRVCLNGQCFTLEPDQLKKIRLT